MNKVWYESKTIWLNVASTLLLLAALFLPGGEFVDLLSAEVVKYIGVGVAALNIILRVWFTEGAIR